jgi:hypothetical protein
MPTPTDFGTWDRDRQIEYLYSTYGNPEDRARENGISGAFAGPKFRSHNVNTQPWVSEEERQLWSQVNRDSGTFLGNAFREAAPAALALGLAAAGGTALLGQGAGAAAGAGTGTGAATGGIGAGFGTNAGGLGYVTNGGAAGLAGLGGGNAGALAASGAITGGAGALGGGMLGNLTDNAGRINSLLGGATEQPEQGGQQVQIPQIPQLRTQQPQQAMPQSGPPILPGMPQGPIQGFSRKPFQFLGQTIWM